MRQNPNYILTELSGVFYLLPFGQAIAEHSRGIQLNATGADIWNYFRMPHSEHDLIEEFCQKYEVSTGERESFCQDISQFLTQLQKLGLLLADHDSRFLWTKPAFMVSGIFQENESWDFGSDYPLPAKILSIGGISLELYGNPNAFSSDFHLFLQEDSAANQKEAPRPTPPLCTQQIFVTSAVPPELPRDTRRICHSQLFVYEYLDAFLLCFPTAAGIRECWLSRDGKQVVIYCTGAYDARLQYDLFHAIRSCFLYLAAKYGMYAIHSASLLYQNRAWLFSGPSGTGKSTHTDLWKEYKKTPILNGDLNLLAFNAKEPAIFGIPWCGTSGICDSRTYPLGGITLLKQDSSNQLYPLSPDKKMLLVLQRLISPLWTREMMEEMLLFLQQIVPEIQVFQLGCTISREAVDTIQSAIDATI